MPDEQITVPHAPAPSTPNADGTAVQSPADRARLVAVGPAVPSVPGFELLSELGRGGMGVVYKARQTGLNREAALKMILGGTADPKELIRFLAEAEAVAAIKHPNVVQVYEYGDHEGRPFLALEYLSGGALSDRLKHGPLAPGDAAGVVEKLARGMQAAHARGIVHRDLKPANVLFDESDEPKVTDFGLAKLGTGADLTHTNAVMGTPAYMAPEQAQGESKFAGPPADVWALGVILYQCLTGKRPFVGDGNMAVLRRITSTEPPAPRAVNRTVPRDLELICLKCLRKAPHERYPDGGALAADLRAFAEGRTVTARPVPAAARAWKWAKRNPTFAALSSGLALALVAGTAVSLWQMRRANAEAANVRTQKEATDRANTDLEAANGKLASEKENVLREKDNVQKELTARVAADGRTYASLDALAPVARAAFARKPKLTAEERAVLARIIDLHKTSAPVGGTAPEARFLVATAHVRVGELHEALGEFAAAEAEFVAARTALARLAAEFPDRPLYREHHCLATEQFGELLAKTPRRAEAAGLLRDARAGFRALADAAPGDANLRYRHATATLRVAKVLADDGHLDPAQDEYALATRELQTALALAQKSGRPVYPIGRAFVACADEVAQIQKRTNNVTGAEASYGIALQALDMLQKQFPNMIEVNEFVAVIRQNRGGLFQTLNRFKEAEADYLVSRTAYAALVAEYSGNPEYKYKQAQVLLNLGMMYRAQRNPRAAEWPIRDAITLSERLAADFPDSLDFAHSAAITRGMLALVAEDFDRPDDAIREATTAADRFRELVKRARGTVQYRADLASTLSNLARNLAKQNKPDGARRLLEESLPHFRALVAAKWNHPIYTAQHRTALELLIGDRTLRKVHAGVPELAAERLAISANRAFDLVPTASVLARCVALIEADPDLSIEVKRTRAGELAEAAMRHLSDAVAAGYPNEITLRDDPALAPLRDRTDFRLLVARVKERNAKQPPKP